MYSIVRSLLYLVFSALPGVLYPLCSFSISSWSDASLETHLNNSTPTRINLPQYHRLTSRLQMPQKICYRSSARFNALGVDVNGELCTFGGRQPMSAYDFWAISFRLVDLFVKTQCQIEALYINMQ